MFPWGFLPQKVFKIGCSFVVPPALNPSGPSGPPAPLVPLVAGVPWGAQCPNGVWGVLELPSFVVQAADFAAFYRIRVLSSACLVFHLGFPSPKVFKIRCSFVVPPALNPSGLVRPTGG